MNPFSTSTRPGRPTPIPETRSPRSSARERTRSVMVKIVSTHRASAPGRRLGGGEDGAVGADQPRRDRRGSDVHADDRIRSGSSCRTVRASGVPAENPFRRATRRAAGASRPCGAGPAGRQGPVGTGGKGASSHGGSAGERASPDAARRSWRRPCGAMPSALARPSSRAARQLRGQRVEIKRGGSPVPESASPSCLPVREPPEVRGAAKGTTLARQSARRQRQSCEQEN